ncbi:MAG: serine/threonine-protein kinase [Planctomycetota bacterium]|nr:serine/threonine-protein kinase [Planctomycetota bacterium]
MDPKLTIDPNLSFGPAAPRRYYYQAGDRPLDGLTIKRAIGRGGFGEVYFAVTDAGKQLALKHITRSVEVERRGAAHCMNIKSPNLIGLYDIRTNPEGATFILMEYVPGPTLKELIEQHPNGMPEKDIRSLMGGLVAGVAQLHAAGIVHRDLKPANVFVDSGIVKVGDYGLSKTITEVDLDHSVSVGTCHYMAPEIRSGRYDKPVDTYALGVILYEMIRGRPPFEGQTVAEILMRHQFDQPELDPIEARYHWILKQTLNKNPALRPKDLYEILRALDHPEKATMARKRNSQPGQPLPGIASGSPEIETDSAKTWFSRLIRGEDAVKLHRKDRIDASTRLSAGQGRWSRLGLKPGKILFEAPPWPNDRQRLRGLVRSLIWSLASCWLMAGPIGFLTMVNMSEAPNRIAFVAVVSALLTSAMLVLQHFWEGWSVSLRQKRLAGLAAGSVVGVAASCLAAWLGVEHRLETMNRPLPGAENAFRMALDQHMLSYAMMGGLSLAIPKWWSLVDRERPSRWGMKSLVRWGIWGLIISQISWSSSQPQQHLSMSFVVIAVTGLVAQFASPWDKALADYAQSGKLSRRRAG